MMSNFKTQRLELRVGHFGCPNRLRLVSVFGFRLPVFSVLVIFVWGSALPSLAQSTNRPGRAEFSAFKLITDRNIFDPRRRSYSTDRRTRDSSRPKRLEYVTLVGTMNYAEKGPLAFFDGTSSDYRKVLKPAETIAGYKVTDIGRSFVKLAVGTNEFDLPVGMQLRRDDQGNWQVAEPAYSSSERTERSPSGRAAPPPFVAQQVPVQSSTNGEPQVAVFDPNSQPMPLDPQVDAGETNTPPEAASSGGETDPVLLRLMQRRSQELSR
jgi:hypothetical protein